MLNVLLCGGAQVECSDDDGIRPIHLADQPDVLRLLLDAKASVHSRTSTGLEPLNLASRITGGNKLMQMLLEANAGVNSLDNEGYSALHMAALHSQLECMQLLLEANAELEIKGKGDRTPLLHAVSRSKKNPKVVELLINAKASIEARGADGFCRNGTALHFGMHV